MRKETTHYVEHGDLIYLIDDNFDICFVELDSSFLREDLDKRCYISDEVAYIDERLVLKNFEISDDQIDLLKVEFFTSSDFQDREDFDESGYRYYETDRKAFTTKESAETYLMTKIDKYRIAGMILKEIRKDLDIHLTEIEKILKNLSDRLKEFDIPENALLDSNLTLISGLCDLLNLDVAEILNLNKE